MSEEFKEARDWLYREPATDWGDHEKRLHNVIEYAENLEAQLAEAKQVLEEIKMEAWGYDNTFETLFHRDVYDKAADTLAKLKDDK